MNKIGSKITSLRKQKNMSQKDLAKKLNISNQLVSKWETDGSMPSAEFLIELSKIFEVSVDEILGLQEGKQTPAKRKKIKINPNFLIAFFGALGVLYLAGMIILTIFVFVPQINKQAYINNLAEIVEQYPINQQDGYFDLTIESYSNNNFQSGQTYKGYVENGEVSYKQFDTFKSGSIFIKQLIINGITYNDTWKSNFIPSITSTSNLFETYVKADFENEFGFEISDITYIRKIGESYIYSLDYNKMEQIIIGGADNAKLLGNVWGNFNIKNGKIQYIDMIVKVKNTDNDKTVEARAVIKFNWQKPNFTQDYEDYQDKLWHMPEEILIQSQEQFLQNLNIGQFEKRNALSGIFDKISSGDYFIHNQNLYIPTSSSIAIYSLPEFEHIHTINMFGVSSSPHDVHIHNGFAYQYYSGGKCIYKVDLITYETENIFSVYSTDSHDYIFKDKYLFIGGYENSPYQNFIYIKLI